MPDYNPDREGHRKHKWVVHNVMQGGKGVRVDGKNMMFNKDGRFLVKDEGLAKNIRKNYPHQVTVSRITANDPSDRGHKYFFTVPRMPWHKDEEESADQDRE